MNIVIKTNHVALTQSIQEYVTKRLSSLKKIVHEDAPDLMVEVEVSRTTEHHKNGDVYKTSINFVYKGKQYYVSAEASDVFAAIDRAKDELMSELHSYKDKKLTLARRGKKLIKDILKGLV